MKLLKLITCSILFLFLSRTAVAQDETSTIFDEGSVNGNIRAYYNTRDYPSRTDEAGFALGGALRAETGRWGETDWGRIGVGFYTAHDLDLNSDDPAEVNNRLGDELEVLGEAYTQFFFGESKLSLGRQLFNTPFANPGDAFIVPMTFSGVSFENKSISNLSLQVHQLNEFKNRNSDEFIDIGVWTTSRLGVAPTATSGTLILGAVYAPSRLNVQGWYYGFDDLFDMVYLQTNYAFTGSEKFKPFVGAQYGNQQETGDELLGAVDSTLWGIMGGAGIGKTKVTLAYNGVAENEDTFSNGAFLAPFSFATSAIFTNSMLETMENVDAGDAFKLTFEYAFSKQLYFKVSHATLDFENAADRDDTDIDIIYQFGGALTGFSIRNRLTIVSSDTESVEQTNNRFQLQYVF